MIGSYHLERRASRGESDQGAWFATDADGVAVVIKRLASRELPRMRALARALDMLRARGCPVPRYREPFLDGDSVVVVQEQLVGRIDVAVNGRTVEHVLAINDQQAGIDAPPPWRDETWGAFMIRTLTEGEDGWSMHEPLRAWSARTRALVERVETIGQGADPSWFASSGIVHLDLHPGNFLFENDGRLAGVVDWEGALPGDHRFDLTSFAFCHAVESGDAAVTEPVWRVLESSVDPRVLCAYAAHQALRLVDWMIRKHTPADVERWLSAGERLLNRYEA